MYCIVSISSSVACVIALFEKQCIEWQKTNTNNENGMLYLHGQRPVLTGFKSKRKLYYLESSLSTNGGFLLCIAYLYAHPNGSWMFFGNVFGMAQLIPFVFNGCV